MEGSEKRRFIRHLLVSPLEFKEADEQPEKTETVNVSEGGLMFLSKRNVLEGKLIDIQMPLYDKVFHIKAKVVHSQADETGLYRVGVSFANFADAFKVKLIEQIYLIEEYRVLRSLQTGKEMSLQEASKEWISRYSDRFEKLYW
ncbi:MAG: PilZ domain-containing protein [Candidatus Omnitrophica bacterium]|nr:PilZ domain-containing protein [Candidatus Omnitrophota bacterium]MDD4012724.1 PilZ domain-containing protein [Candidatus Omnitrophota bacterium]